MPLAALISEVFSCVFKCFVFIKGKDPCGTDLLDGCGGEIYNEADLMRVKRISCETHQSVSRDHDQVFRRKIGLPRGRFVRRFFLASHKVCFLVFIEGGVGYEDYA